MLKRKQSGTSNVYILKGLPMLHIYSDCFSSKKQRYAQQPM